MDDDLMSLRGNRNTSDDDLFAAFSDLGASPDEGELGALGDLGDMSDLDRGFTSSSSLPLADEAPDWIGGFQEGGKPTPVAPEAPARGHETPKVPQKEGTAQSGFRFGRQAVPSSRAVPQPTARPRSRRSGGMLLGMTPQQRMILSIFLFLDVTILGFLILIAIGAISL
jgi:hypothetical protein